MAADGSIILKTEIDESGLKSGLSSLKSGIGKVGKAFAVVGAAAAGMTAAFVKGTKDTAEFGDRVDKLSQKIGMSKESFQQWDYIMQINGASIETLQAGMKTLSTAAQNGSDAFDKLGLSEEFVKSASPEELFESTIGKLQEMEEGTERTAIASKLLGRSATELAPLLNSEAASIEELKKQAIDYGMVMSNEAVAASAAFSDSMTTLGMTATGLKNKLMAEFLPALTQVTDGLALLFTGDMSGLDKINEGISEFVGKITEILPKIIEIGGSIIQGLISAIVQNIPQLVETGSQLLVAIITGIAQALPQLIAYIPTIVDNLISGLLGGLSELTPAIKALAAIILTVAAATKAMSIAQAAATVATKIATAAQWLWNVALTANPIGIIIVAIGALIAALGALAFALANEETAIKDVTQAQEDLNAAKEAAKEAEDAYINAVDRSENALKKLEEAERESGLSGKELYTQVQSGTLDYKNMTEAQREVYKAYIESTNAQKELEEQTQSYNEAKKAETIASFENQIALAKEQGSYEDVKKAIVDAYNEGSISAEEARDLIGASMSEMSRASQKTFMEDVPNSIKDGLNPRNYETTWQQISKWFIQAWEDIKTTFTQVGEWFGGVFSQAWEAIKSAFGSVGTFFAGIWESIKSAFSNALNSFAQIGQNIVNGLWNGIQNAKNWLIGKIQSWCGSVLNAIKGFFGIHSPSTVMRDQVGKMIPKGMAIGIDKAKNLVTKATKALVEDTRSEVQKVIDDMNAELLDSEKKYAEESLRIEREKEEREYQEKIKAAKTEEERQKIESERQIQIQEKQQKEYLDNLKDTADRERKIHEARQKDVQNAQKKIVDAYDDAASEILNSIEELQKRQQELANRLANYGTIMEDVKTIQDKFSDVHSPLSKNNLDHYVLNDIRSQTYELEKYEKTLTELRNRAGMSSELFDVIIKMNFEESLAYAQKLMRLNDDKFDAYIANWKKKQETSKRITEELFSDEGTVSAQRILSDLSQQTQVLKDYYNLLEAVKNRADVPKEFFAALRDMGIEEGLEYANALLELSDEDFAKYIQDWQEKQKTSQLISKELYRDEADELSREITDKFEEVRKSFFAIGENSADEFEKGFLDNLRVAISNIKRTINNAFGNVGLGSYGGNFSVSVPGLARGAVLPPNREFLAVVGDQKRGTNIEAPLDTIVEAMNIALANRNVGNGNTEVVLEIDGREFGRAIVEQGDKENRRIGTRLVIA